MFMPSAERLQKKALFTAQVTQDGWDHLDPFLNEVLTALPENWRVINVSGNSRGVVES
jgi:hypothetical protein